MGKFISVVYNEFYIEAQKGIIRIKYRDTIKILRELADLSGVEYTQSTEPRELSKLIYYSISEHKDYDMYSYTFYEMYSYTFYEMYSYKFNDQIAITRGGFVGYITVECINVREILENIAEDIEKIGFNYNLKQIDLFTDIEVSNEYYKFGRAIIQFLNAFNKKVQEKFKKMPKNEIAEWCKNNRFSFVSDEDWEWWCRYI